METSLATPSVWWSKKGVAIVSITEISLCKETAIQWAVLHGAEALILRSDATIQVDLSKTLVPVRVIMFKLIMSCGNSLTVWINIQRLKLISVLEQKKKKRKSFNFLLSPTTIRLEECVEAVRNPTRGLLRPKST